MTDKKLLFLFTLVFLQTACTENPVRPTSTTVKKTQQSRVTRSKSTAIPTRTYTYEPGTVEEIPIQPQKSAVPAVEPVPESKPRPQLSAAAQSLLVDAERSTKAGDLDSASVMLERALRISPRNAELTYQLAALRLKQSQPRLAEDLGKKAAFLAADDRELKKQCWLLIAEARLLQGNTQGAREAQLKADGLESSF